MTGAWPRWSEPGPTSGRTCVPWRARWRWPTLTRPAHPPSQRPPHATRSWAAGLLAGYREFSAEAAPPSLEHHYIAYRAHVRAKVACLSAAQGGAAGAQDARTLLDLCVHHLGAGRVRLVVVSGLPGTGKSTV